MSQLPPSAPSGASVHDRSTIRVAFNATALLAPLTGIGHYITELGRCLPSDVDAYSYYAYRWRHERPSTPKAVGQGGRTILRAVRALAPVRDTARLLAKHVGFRRGLRRFGIQLYHEANYVPLAYDVPVVVTIHDLSWIRSPDAHPVDRVRWLARGVPKALERAAAVLVDSEFVRQEVLETFGGDGARIRVVHLGVTEDFRPRGPETTRQTLASLGVAHGAYVLAVGTLEPRKNLAHVVQAHKQLSPVLRARFPLVVAGAKGWRSTERALESQMGDDPHVRLVPEVDRAGLLDLYAGAAVFVFPSLYEGFGLPPLEAMASGVPVLVSARASLPEVVGDAAAFLDPEDADSTATRLGDLLEDPARRAQLVLRGLERARQLTWERCADATRAVYGHAVARRFP